jgi:hypothetical protein
MSTWNYRIVRYDGGTEDECVGIVECYYNDAGLVQAYSKKPCGILADTVDDLREVLEMVKEAFDKPVLEMKDLPGYIK